MGTIILILVIVFIIWPIVRAALMFHKIRSQAKRVFRQAAQSQREAGEEQRRANRKGGWSRSRNRKPKVIQRNEGEYVEWEEITVTDEQPSGNSSGRSSKRVKVESQISDAEWEDIKTSDSDR